MSKDIDFDELDKAVNSLMGGVAGKAPQDDDARQNTLSISTTLQPNEKPAYQRIEEVAKTIGSETLTVDAEKRVVLDESPQSALPSPVRSVGQAGSVSVSARPTTGRFMDVVHPSSQMRPAASDLPPLVVPDRGDITKTPQVPPKEELATQDIVSSPEPIIVPATESAPPVVEEAHMPAIGQVKMTPPEPILEEPAPVVPLTPFLPDAKVEKRPLGEPIMPIGAVPSPFEPSNEAANSETPINNEPVGATGANSVTDELDDVAESPTEETASPSDASPTEAQPVVDELSAVELSEPEAQGSVDVKPTVLPEPANADPTEVINMRPEADISVRTVESGDTEQLTAIRQAAAADLGSSATGDDEVTSGSIYDIDNQPRPVIYPTKQKSGLLTVVIILVIIILAAALGVAAYFVLGLSA